MNVIFKYHFYQLYNFWRQLGLRIQIEIIILFIIFFTFFTGKLNSLFAQLLSKPNVTELGLTGIVIHALLILTLFSTPFIYFNLIPKQRGLKILCTQPISSAQALSSLLLYFFKYELILFLFLAPVFTSLLITAGVMPQIYGLVTFISFSIYSVILIHFISIKTEKKISTILRYSLICTGYFVIYFYLYWNTNIAIYADLFIIISTLFILKKIWKSYWPSWDQIITRVGPVLARSEKKISGLQYSDLSFIRPESIRPLYIKDFLSQFRNKHYVKLKIISLLIYISTLLIVQIFFSEAFIPVASILTLMLVWEHYSHQFNEKYSGKEPRYFYKVLPIRFYQIIIAKFLSEFLYILIIILILSLFLIIQQFPIEYILVFIGMVLIVSAFILYLMILVRTLFYDNPRFAGYAYHLMILFTTVMILNFHLVGPLVSIGILIYLNIKSYSQFNR